MQENNNKNRNNNRQNNNRQQMKKRLPPPKNPDPMGNTKAMGHEGMRLIRNMAFGKFNKYTEGHVFRNPDFVKATLFEVEKRAVDAWIHLSAIRYAYYGNEDPRVIRLLHRDTKAYEAYNIIKECLNSILMTGDTLYLNVLVNQLPKYKRNI